MNTMIGAFTSVWTAVSTWITGTITSTQSIFYGEGGLTFLGVAAAGAVAVGIGLLILNKVTDLIKFR